jgi:undecaprenyl-diphosphatase
MAAPPITPRAPAPRTRAAHRIPLTGEPATAAATFRTASLVALGTTAALALLTRTRAVQRLDDAVEDVIGRRRPRLAPAARIGTLPGESYMHPTIGAVVALAILHRRGGRRRRILIPMASASLGAIVAHHAVKAVYRRRRPEIALRRGKLEPAFPSGHTADATAVLATGTYLLVREGMLSPRVAVPVAVALAVATGTSRVVLGWHWSSDVIGGWATGLGVAAECALLYERFGKDGEW